jgi:hypothetical protein
MVASVRTQGGFEVGSRTQLFEGAFDDFVGVRDYDVAPDGQSFLMFQPVQGTEQTVFVTLNWFNQMRRPRR